MLLKNLIKIIILIYSNRDLINLELTFQRLNTLENRLHVAICFSKQMKKRENLRVCINRVFKTSDDKM